MNKPNTFAAFLAYLLLIIGWLVSHLEHVGVLLVHLLPEGVFQTFLQTVRVYAYLILHINSP